MAKKTTTDPSTLGESYSHGVFLTHMSPQPFDSLETAKQSFLFDMGDEVLDSDIGEDAYPSVRPSATIKATAQTLGFGHLADSDALTNSANTIANNWPPDPDLVYSKENMYQTFGVLIAMLKRWKPSVMDDVNQRAAGVYNNVFENKEIDEGAKIDAYWTTFPTVYLDHLRSNRNDRFRLDDVSLIITAIAEGCGVYREPWKRGRVRTQPGILTSPGPSMYKYGKDNVRIKIGAFGISYADWIDRSEKGFWAAVAGSSNLIPCNPRPYRKMQRDLNDFKLYEYTNPKREQVILFPDWERLYWRLPFLPWWAQALIKDMMDTFFRNKFIRPTRSVSRFSPSLSSSEMPNLFARYGAQIRDMTIDNFKRLPLYRRVNRGLKTLGIKGSFEKMLLEGTSASDLPSTFLNRFIPPQSGVLGSGDAIVPVKIGEDIAGLSSFDVPNNDTSLYEAHLALVINAGICVNSVESALLSLIRPKGPIPVLSPLHLEWTLKWRSSDSILRLLISNGVPKDNAVNAVTVFGLCSSPADGILYSGKVPRTRKLGSTQRVDILSGTEWKSIFTYEKKKN